MNKIDITPKIGAWGIWDKHGRCWIGNEDGPQTYADTVINGHAITGNTLARLGATVFNQRMGEGFRFAARQYTEHAKTKRDNITMPKDAVTALNEILAQAGAE